MIQSFSVCTSVYKNDRPEFVKVALDSMLMFQSLKPSEIVIVQDGPVPDSLFSLLLEYEEKYNDIVRIIRLETNMGLGNALKVGVENASFEIIARMDSDDICLPNRFQKQVEYLEKHPEVDILGGQMTEFIDNPENIVGIREVPLSNADIYEYMKNRCALNHVTVMFRKSAVINVGNYQDFFWNEDYYLWVRMMKDGCVFANLPDVLVNVRSGLDQYSRRGGKKYFDSEVAIKRIMLEHGMISRAQFIKNYIIRFIVQLMLPNRVRGWVFRTFARRK